MIVFGTLVFTKECLPETEKFVEVRVAKVYYDYLNDSHVVLLEPIEGEKQIYLPIYIGSAEANAIKLKLNRQSPVRPLTHDLIVEIMDKYNIRVIDVRIDDIKENIFLATLSLSRDKKNFQLDARPSDCIAIALRVGCPIFVKNIVIEKVGIEKDKLEQKRKELEKELEKFYKEMEELEEEEGGGKT
jgi:hypothetical protein